MRPRILIIDPVHSSMAALLDEAGFMCDYQPHITRQEIIQTQVQYAGIIVRSKTLVDAALLIHQKAIKFIARAGAGTDQIDTEYLKSRNIAMLSAPEGNRDALAEHVIGLLLNLSNQLRKADAEVRQGIWDREGNRGFEIQGKTIGLLGYGMMGSAVAEKLSGFGCRVIAYDKYKRHFTDAHVEEVSKQEIFEQSDVFSLHVPLTPETRGMVDTHYLNQFKKPIVFINAARGEMVSLHALLDALAGGQVRLVALDVLENEKLHTLTPKQKTSFHRLIQSNQVLLSPHVGGWTVESYRKINEVLVKKIIALYAESG